MLARADEAPDDMAVCLVRPVPGADALSPRVEVLELEPDDVASGFAARFLESCGVPASGIAVAVDDARAAMGADGPAVLEVTMTDGIGRARVSGGAAVPPAAAV